MADTLSGAERILLERTRQVNKDKPWTAKHDDKHDRHELVYAAISYAAPDYEKMALHCGGFHFKRLWPWMMHIARYDDEYVQGIPTFKEKRIDNLVIAGALIAAEIDRLQRLEDNNNQI